MSGTKQGPSVKNPKQYEGLRDKGMSKERATAISNARCASSCARVSARFAASVNCSNG